MNIQQLRYLCALEKTGYSVSRSAELLHTSQPAVSQQVSALERELGLLIFLRDRQRLVGLTKDGERILSHAHLALNEIQAIQTLARASDAETEAKLIIATTHTQARYVLPKILKAFLEKHPQVQVALKHGNPAEVAESLAAGTAHLGVIQVTQPSTRDILILEAFQCGRIVVVPRKHALLRLRTITLNAIAKYPLITYEQTSAVRQQVFGAFEAAGLQPHVILSALDADVIKECVVRELGIAILPEVTFSPERDPNLRAINSQHLFPPSVSGVALHRKHPVNKYVWDLLALFAPQWKRGEIDRLRNIRSGSILRNSTPYQNEP